MINSFLDNNQDSIKHHVIVVGNEKGGAGKTTATMHLIASLLKFGFKVGSIDLDSRQQSVSRYIDNRRETIAKTGLKVPLPSHAIVKKSPFNDKDDIIKDEQERFDKCINTLSINNDFIVIDTPGSDTNLSRYAHSYANHIITPINDSFVDLDVLAHIDSETLTIERPGVYSEMIWEQKIARAKRNNGEESPIEWIVMRNRLSNIDANNKRRMAEALKKLSRRVGFRSIDGFSERVIFRELFLSGLTLVDIMDKKTNFTVKMSHIAARQELRELLKELRIPAITKCLNEEINGSNSNNDAASKVTSDPARRAEIKVTKVNNDNQSDNVVTNLNPSNVENIQEADKELESVTN
ncbi:MAG: division plane positioning ATPase MipZ [Pseudomonadota bacterium]